MSESVLSYVYAMRDRTTPVRCRRSPIDMTLDRARLLVVCLVVFDMEWVLHGGLPGSASPLSGFLRGCVCQNRKRNLQTPVLPLPVQNWYGTARARMPGDRTCSMRRTTCVS